MGITKWSYVGLTKPQARDAERRAAWLRKRRAEKEAKAKAEKLRLEDNRAKFKKAKLTHAQGQPNAVAAATPLPVLDIDILSPLLPVPAPSERIQPDDVTYCSRDGQAAFREMILTAYGRCAVTGCKIESVLEAAHIIPYVDARSHLVSNGLCLRADIHRLYDRGLLQIGADFVVRIAPALAGAGYAKLDKRLIALPARGAERPDPNLLAVRHLYICL